MTRTDESLDEFRKKCREQDLAVTTQRLAVYRFLAGTVSHPSPDEVYEAVRTEFPSLSRMSVYRILEAFSQRGLIKKLVHSGNRVRFDANVEPHCHLVCQKCGRIIDIMTVDPALNKIPFPQDLPEEFEIQECFVLFAGVCGACSEN